MIAFLGEALIDLIGGIGADGQPCFHYYAGGCALNAATAAARLDSEVLYVGKLSADMFGKQMQEHFRKNSVQVVRELCDVPQNSMIGFAKLDDSGSASYSFYIDGTTVTSLSSDEILDALEDRDELHYLHVGSVAVALDRSGNEILKALKRLDPKPFIFFDPNVRPTVIDDFDAYRKRVLSIARLSSMIKLSHEDLSLLFPGIASEQALDYLMDLGVAHVVLTKGKDGLHWRSQGSLDVHVPAVDNPIVDTVGAGDTVSGALLTYLEEHGMGTGDPIDEDHAREALVFAAAAAAVTTGRKGADPPRRSEIVIADR
ncbi:MAG: PfkB family carbohydrate kinase [Sphaerochaetaceae bacterium]|jgi:fructokinase|nr:PfkB family carbohydrate kinase [Sphaerochaetaceae bacterium]MDX9938996.1 PfkB family carbohydrate kinase [Sphaerochaetaceae bacterium]